MKIIKKIRISLSPQESLLVLQGLSYIIDDEEAHELDRKGAEKLRIQILEEAERQGEEIGKEWGAFLL